MQDWDVIYGLLSIIAALYVWQKYDSFLFAVITAVAWPVLLVVHGVNKLKNMWRAR